MELSARNQLNGTITDVNVGGIMGEVTIDIGGQQIVAAITRGSIERLGLAVGQQAVAIIKATEVLIAKP
jgi:molybdopterin-binding protein